MPDITINVRVIGSNTAASELKQVGTAASQTGSEVQTAGSRFSSFGSRVAGAVAGIGLFSAGLFGMADAFQGVEKANLAVDRAQKRSDDATKTLEKAQKALADVVKSTTTAWSSNNGEVGSVTKNILAYDAATGEATVQTRNHNGEVSVSKEKNAELGVALQNLSLAQQGVAIQAENLRLKQEDAAQAQAQLAFSVLSSASQMGAGIATIIAFKTATGGLSTVTKETGGAFSGLGGNLLKIGIPLAAVAAAYLVLKFNVGGALDSLNAFGVSLGKAVPALQPLLNLLKDIGGAIGIGKGGGFEQIKRDLAGLQNQLAPVADAIKTKFGEISHSFSTFIQDLAKGNLSGAFSQLTASFTKLGTDIMGAIRSVNWSQVWQGLQDAFNSTVNFITTSAADIGASVANIIKNWNWADAWKSLQDAFRSSLNFLKNITAPVILGIKWIIGNVIQPGIEELKQHLPTWPQITQAVSEFINWTVAGATWLAGEVSKHLPTWGQVNQTVNEIIDWTVAGATWLAGEAAKHLPTWGQISQTVGEILKWTIVGAIIPPAPPPPEFNDMIATIGLTIKWSYEKVIFPATDTLVSSVLDNITTAIRNAPGAAQKIGQAIQDMIFNAFPKSVDAKGKTVTTTGFTIAGAQSAIESFVMWVQNNLPKTVKSLNTLAITFGQIDWSGMQNAMNRAGSDIAAFLWNTVRAKIKEASGGIVNLPRIPFQAEIDLRNIDQEIGKLNNKLKTATGADKAKLESELKIKEGEKDKILQETSKIPAVLKTTMTLDTTGAYQQISQLQSTARAAFQNVSVNVPRQAGSTAARPQYAAAGFGPDIVRKPTLILAGEAGPEMVHVVPMAGGSSGKGFTNAFAGGIGGVSSGTNNFDYDRLMSLVQKLIMLWSSRGEQNLNLIVDGQRMAAAVQKHMGSKSYGDR